MPMCAPPSQRMLAAVIFAAGLGGSAAADLAGFERPSSLVVFGDSLSDTGNFFDATGGLFPPPPYFEGRLSNGRLWVERLADRLGVGISDNRAVALDTSTSMRASRLPAYLADNSGSDPDALYTIFIGGNDFLGEFGRIAANPSVADSIAGVVAGNVEQTITALAADGASRFLLMNLGDFGATPQADVDAADAGNPDILQAATDATGVLNAALASTASNLRSDLGVDIVEFDTDAFFEGVAQDPSRFGLTNIDDNVLQPDLSLIGDPNEFLWWDLVHPTARGHELLGDAVFEFLVPAPGTWMGVVALVPGTLRRQRA